MALLKQSTARNRVFKMISSTDHFTLKTGAAPVVNLSKNAGAFGVAGGAVSEIANGWYSVALSTTDTGTLGDLAFYITGTGADDTDFVDQVSALIEGDLATPTNITAGTITTVTNLTNLPTIPANWLTAAGTAVDFGTEIAAAVWQDAVAGDFTVGSSIGKALYIANLVPGAAGGHFISGSNAGTTTVGALTVTGVTTLTGNMVLSDGLTISAPSTLNRAGITVTGNGSGRGATITGGTAGSGMSITAGAGGAQGLLCVGPIGIEADGAGNSGHGLLVQGGTTNSNGLLIVGGATSGDGLKINTTSGHGINLAPVGTSMHGLFTTGGNGGTSDGIKAVAGTGGVPIRGDITGNVTGNLSGSVGSVTGAVGSVTGAVGSVTGNVGGNVVGSAGSVVGAVGSVTAAVGITSNIKQNQALANFEFMMTDSTTHAPATGLAVTVTRSIDGGAFAAGGLSAVTEVSNGIYRVDFAASDLNGKVITLRAIAAASDDTFERVVTQI